MICKMHHFSRTTSKLCKDLKLQMKLALLFLGVFTNTLCSITVQNGAEVSYASFVRTTEARLTKSSAIIWTGMMKNDFQCMRECVRGETCKSYNVREESDGRVTCELLSIWKYTNAHHFQCESGWTHYSMQSVGCEINPCKEGKDTCVPTSNSFTCTCTNNFGRFCQFGPAYRLTDGVTTMNANDTNEKYTGALALDEDHNTCAFSRITEGMSFIRVDFGKTMLIEYVNAKVYPGFFEGIPVSLTVGENADFTTNGQCDVVIINNWGWAKNLCKDGREHIGRYIALFYDSSYNRDLKLCDLIIMGAPYT